MGDDLNILVTGAGGDSGIATIRSLCEDHYVVAADCDKNAAGLRLAQESVVLPPAQDPKFLEAVSSVIAKNKIDFIFPNVDEELIIFASNLHKIPQAIISDSESISTCLDKIKTINRLKKVIPTPNYPESYPAIIRPSVSRGSRDVFKVCTVEEADLVIALFEERGLEKDRLLIQEFLPGDEVTVDAVCDSEGRLVVACPRVRMATKGGICSVGRSIHNDKLVQYVKRITETLKFYGPINIQFKQDNFGEFKLLEINPRCAGSLSITKCNGVNIPSLSLSVATNEKISERDLQYKDDTVYRILSEI